MARGAKEMKEMREGNEGNRSKYLIKPMENQFSNAWNTVGKSLQNEWDFSFLEAHNRKRPPKQLEKHWLAKVFATTFCKAGIPYKTNGKSMISGPPNRHESPRWLRS